MKDLGDSSWNPYLFCLLVSDRQFYSPTDRSPRLFEHLACEALASYLTGDAIRFGDPRDTMPIGIHDALDELCRLTGDRRISEGIEVNATDKDLGLDVVGWKDFNDGQRNKLQVYMQCATGENWTGKRGEPDIEIWCKILLWNMDPVRALAIPYVASEEEWEREGAGILLMDRLRLALLLAGMTLPDQERGWSVWCEERIATGRAALDPNE